MNWNDKTANVIRLLNRSWKIRREKGWSEVTKRLFALCYAELWPILPSNGPQVYNSIKVGKQKKITDTYVPMFLRRYVPDDIPNYEGPLIAAINKYIHVGDEIVIVGGGVGVSSVAAAKATGERGHIHMFEASESQLSDIAKTIEINNVGNLIEIQHAIVGSYSDYSTELYGNTDDAEIIDSSELPSCDVLELDCEGAELEILRNMEIRPRTIIVETHGFLGSNKEEVSNLLKQLNYKIVSEQPHLESEGVFVLVGTKQGYRS